MAKAKPISGLDPHVPTSRNARLIARARLAEMYDWERYIDDSRNARELHNLRISAKRLRYTLEVFEDVLPESCKPVVKEVEQIQEELGALHDSDVMIVLLRLCLGKQRSATLEEPAGAVHQNSRGKERPLLHPELVADLLDPAAAPSAGERQGFERLLVRRQETREEQYKAFRQHWDQLQKRGFRHHVLDILDT